jgi:hypothetical protein
MQRRQVDAIEAELISGSPAATTSGSGNDP